MKNIKIILLTFLIVCAIALQGCATVSTHNRDIAVAAAYAGVAADIASTKYKLGEGCIESNPLIGKQGNDGALLISAGVRVGAIYFLDWYLSNHANTQDVTWPFWALAVVQGGVAAHNLSVDCKGVPK